MDRRSSILLIAGGAVLLAALLAPGAGRGSGVELARGSGDKVRLTLERWKPGNHWSTSTDVPFAPDPNFVAELNQQTRLRCPTDEQLFSMLLMDVGFQFARGVRDAGLHASTGQLIHMRIHGLTTD